MLRFTQLQNLGLQKGLELPLKNDLKKNEKSSLKIPTLISNWKYMHVCYYNVGRIHLSDTE